MTPTDPAAAPDVDAIVEAVIREMNRSDIGISVKDWDAHVRARRANAAKVIDAALADARIPLLLQTPSSRKSRNGSDGG